MTTTDVNGGVEGLWLTVSDLARQKGIDKGAISRRIARFEADGLLSTRPGPRGAKLICLAEYERVARQHLDAAKVQAVQTAAALHAGASSSGSSGSSNDPVLSREQARRVAYQADIARLELGERTRKLVPVDRLETEAQRLIEPVVKVLDRLPSHADDIVAAHNESGVQGVRSYLKGFSKRMRNEMARALAELALSVAGEPQRALAQFEPNAARSTDEQPDEADTETQ